MIVGRDKTKKDGCMLGTVINKMHRKEYDLNHPLQRKSGQWTNDTKSGLIATIIKQEDIDSIKICEQIENGKVHLWVIDGMQRLSTSDEYKNNVFKIGKNIKFPICTYFDTEKNEIIEYDLRGKYYKDLPEQLKERFDCYQIDIVKQLDCTDDEVAYHIGRYNDQTSMNSNQKNVLVMPNIAEKIKSISENTFFDDNCVLKASDRKKGVVDRIVTESILVMFHLDNYKTGAKMCSYLDQNADDEEFEIFEDDIERLKAVIDQEEFGSCFFNSKYSFLFFNAFHTFSTYGLEDKKFAEFLKEFKTTLQYKTLEEYNNQSFADYGDGRRTRDKKYVLARVTMLEKAMKNYFGINDFNETSDLEEDSETIVGENEDFIIPEELKEYVDNFKNSDTVLLFNSDNEKLDRLAIDVLSFVQKNINESKDYIDVELYMSILDEWTVNIPQDSWILRTRNIVSLVGIIAYACDIEMDDVALDWFIDFVKTKQVWRNDNLAKFNFMKENLSRYINVHNA